MKRIISCILIAAMLLGLLCTTAFAETGGTAVISPSEFACIKNGDENKTGLDGSGYFMVSSDKSDNPATPVESGFWKYDLSQYLDEGYGIEKAEMLLLADSYTWTSITCMYDCPTDDLKTGSNYLTVPKTSKDSLIARFSNQNLSSVSENYSGVDGDYNVAVDITDYVKGKISDGKKSFTYMLYPSWGESTYRFKGEPVLYITLGEKNADVPLIEYISDNSGDENAKNFTASVNATDSNGVEKVEFYLDGVLMDGKVEKTENTYTYTGRILSPGAHTLTVKAYDTYGKTSTYTKEISVNSTIAILDPYAKVHVKNGDKSSSSVSANGGGNVSTIGGSNKDVENPIEALYYRFDLSEYTQNNIGIEKAYILQNAEGRNYSTLLGMYDCADDTLENGMNYLTVPKASLDGLVTSFNVTNPENVDLSKYPGVTNDYNLEFDVTEYVQKKTDKGTGFTYMLYPKYDGSAYTFSSAPILYLKLGAQNPDYPVAEFVSAKTQYTDSGNFTEQIKASDSNGIGSIEFYLGDNRIEGDFEKSGDIYTFTGAPLIAGSYTLKAIVRDIYGRSTSCEKDITVSQTRAFLDPAAFAYTAWGDESQTSEKYKQENGDTAYWAYATTNSSDGGIQNTDSEYWTQPKRALYHKFDVSQYVDEGYSITKAYLVQNGQTGGETYGVLLDCPSDSLKNGDNYLTVPEHDKVNIISKFSVGMKTDTYYSPSAMQYNFSGARSEDNFALDITNYVTSKIAGGSNSFTVMEYPRYTSGQIRFGNSAQLYIEFTKKSDISLIDTSSLAYEGMPAVFAVKASDDCGIEKVEFYLNEELVAQSNISVNGIYAASADVADGTYALKVKVTNTKGASTVSIFNNYNVTGAAASDLRLQDVDLGSDFAEFENDGVSYLFSKTEADLSELTDLFGSYKVYAYTENGTQLSADDALGCANVVTVKTSDNSAVIRRYIVVKDGYYSPIDLKIVTGKNLVTASAKVYSKDSEDLYIMILGYDKEDNLIKIERKPYMNTVGDASLYTETQRGDAVKFKALLWSDMKPVALPVIKKIQSVILKFDDYSIWAYSGFNKLMDYLDAEQIPAGFGTVAKTFDNENEENYTSTPYYDGLYEETVKSLKRANDNPLYEIWSHGYAHAEKEFSTDDYDSMKNSMQKAVDTMAKYGVEITAFGAPFNTATSTTVKMIDECFPKIRTLMLFNNFITMPDGMVNIQNHAEPETETGVVSYDYFIKNYEKYKDADYVLLQSHPGMWNDESMAEFKKIIEFLKDRGVEFMRPTQYRDYVIGE